MGSFFSPFPLFYFFSFSSSSNYIFLFIIIPFFSGVMPLVERVAQSKNENLKLACIMALYNLRLSFIHLKAHKEVSGYRVGGL